MFLIDTNVVIRAFSGKNPDAKFLRRVIEKRRVNLSVITIAEFLTKASKKEQQSFEKLLRNFPILDINETVARQAAIYRKKYLKKARAKMLDYLIASQAKVHNLILVTNNKSDFPMKDISIIVPS